MIDKILEFIDSHFNRKDVIFIPIVLVLFALLRLPSVIEPYWYGDEGIYEVVGKAIRDGRILYSQIWDNKPPALYIIYAIFDGDQQSVRLASIISGLFSVIVFFAIAKRIFQNNIASRVSTIFFAIMFAIPTLEGNIANAENFMVLPTLITFYILFCTKAKNTFVLTGIAGIILSLSFLTKIVAIFDFAAFSIALFSLRFFDEISFRREKIISEIKKAIVGLEQEIVFGIAFAVPVLATALYFILIGVFPDFFKAVFSQNISYVGYGNYFLFAGGLLYLKLFVLLSVIMLAVRYRRILGKSGLVIFIWVFFSVFNALFSARPYTHYILVALPAFSLLLGYILDNKKIARLTIPVALIVLIILLQTFRLNFRKAVPYYLNYIEYMTGNKEVEKYQAFFDRHTPRDYAIADFIKTKTTNEEYVFLWGDSAQIYALSGKLPPGRYTVSYHITFYKNAIEETKQAFSKNPPKYIIQLKVDDTIENFLDGFELRYKLDDTKIYERQS